MRNKKVTVRLENGKAKEPVYMAGMMIEHGDDGLQKCRHYARERGLAVINLVTGKIATMKDKKGKDFVLDYREVKA